MDGAAASKPLYPSQAYPGATIAYCWVHWQCYNWAASGLLLLGLLRRRRGARACVWHEGGSVPVGITQPSKPESIATLKYRHIINRAGPNATVFAYAAAQVDWERMAAWHSTA